MEKNQGPVMPIPMGEFNIETSYKRLNWVTYTDGCSYVARKDVTGVLPTDETSWKKFFDPQVALEPKADKVTEAKENNFAALDKNGNLKDSGKAAADFATSAQGKTADNLKTEIDEAKGQQASLKEYLRIHAFETYTHAKTETTHALTLDGGANKNIQFIATARYDSGDTFTLNDEPVTALTPDGNALSDGFFAEGAVVIAFFNDNTLYFVGGGAASSGSLESQVTITLSTSGGEGTTTGQNVKITNEEDGSVLQQFSYSGQPHTFAFPIVTQCRVHVDDMQEYQTPADVVFTVTGENKSIIMTYEHGTRYGFQRSKTNSNPTDCITYLYDAVDKTPMSVTLTNGEPNYGDWKDFVDQMVRPVMLRTDGTVDYEQDHDDQSKKLDGSPSAIANTAYDGNAMVEFSGPFIWVKRYEDDENEYVIFSNCKYDSDYYAYAHTNANGEIKPAFYWGMFKGTFTNNRLRSIGTGAVMVSTTRQQEVDRAVLNGTGYYTIYKSGWDYIADVLTLISKSDSSQTIFGYGRCKSNNSAAIAVGTLTKHGAFWGSSDQTSDVKVLYIEGAWGNVWEGMAGLILDGANGIKVKMTPPYNMTGADYEATNISPSGTSGGYVNTESVTRLGYVPKTANGSETTYRCDGLWYNNGQVDYALVGGDWSYAGGCGSRCVSLNTLASNTYAYFGSRLSYIPV